MLIVLFPAWTGGREAVLRWLSHARGVAFAAVALVTLIGGGAAAAGYTQQHTAAPWMARICRFVDQTPTPRR
jgi:hypothetical protein